MREFLDNFKHNSIFWTSYFFSFIFLSITSNKNKSLLSIHLFSYSSQQLNDKYYELKKIGDFDFRVKPLFNLNKERPAITQALLHIPRMIIFHFCSSEKLSEGSDSFVSLVMEETDDEQLNHQLLTTPPDSSPAHSRDKSLKLARDIL